jgi:hypothetical protein
MRQVHSQPASLSRHRRASLDACDCSVRVLH